MVEINVYWYCWLSMALYPLREVSEGTWLSSMVGFLDVAKTILDGFDDDRAFPKTLERIKELKAFIEQLVPQTIGQFSDRQLTHLDTVQLRSAVNAIALTLEQESRHSHVLYLHDQRCLSVHSLVEKIENCFSPEVWNTIETIAKREFDECGKCLALERYTGAGFHALRGVECVIRQYIVQITGALPQKRDWGHYVDVLRKNNADAGLLAVLDNMRSLERNPLMHPEDWLNIDDALGIFTLSQTATARLVDDMKRKKAVKP